LINKRYGKPTANMNTNAVLGTILSGGCYSELEILCGTLNIPTISHQSYDDISTHICNIAIELAMEICLQNVQVERQLSIEKGNEIDIEERVLISGSYDGN
jgi:hypothetical protein